MYAIYGNIYHQYTPVMLASIYHTWILRVYSTVLHVFLPVSTWSNHAESIYIPLNLIHFLKTLQLVSRHDFH